MYYNVDNLEEAREIDKERARRILIRDKKRKQMEEEKISEILKMEPSKEREEKLALLSDLDWVERFNDYSESSFINRYQQYFNTTFDSLQRPILPIEIKDWDKDLKNQLKALDLPEQYEIISNIIKEEFFKYGRDQKMEESQIESSFMNYTLLLDAGSDLLN